MLKMSKLLSIVFLMAIFTSAYAGERGVSFQNQKFEQLKKTMWVAGLADISMGQVPEIPGQEYAEEVERVELPEELVRPLLRKVDI
jgi:hypothetical protein